MQRFYGEKRDEYGRAEVGASVSVYDTGTSNLSAIYEASDPLTTPASAIPNPFTTDSNGRYAFAAPTGVYDIVVHGTGSVEYKNKVAMFDQTTSTTTTAGGASTEIQYNTGGVLSGSASLTTDGTNLSVAGYSSVEATRFNTSTPDTSNVVGNTYWDSANGTLATVLDATAGVVLQHGQELHISCVNKTGSIIPDGSAVYVNDAQGNRPTCALAKADNLTTCQVVGVTTQAIGINATGLVTIAGDVHGFNTSVFSADGRTLYLSASTYGAITDIAPVSPNYLVTIGTNLNTTSNGTIFVNPSRPVALDTTLSADSGLVAPSQKATKAYTDTLRSDLASTASTALGDALIGVKSTLTGGVARTQHEKNADSVNAADFGFSPGASAAVNTAALVAALAAAKRVVMNEGTFAIKSISILKDGVSGVWLSGAGGKATFLVPDGTTSNFFTLGSTVAQTNFCTYTKFNGFCIDMTSMADSVASRGLYIRDGYNHVFEDVNVIGVQNTNKIPLYIDNRAYAITFNNCDFWGYYIGTGGKLVLYGLPVVAGSGVTTAYFNTCSFQQANMTSCANIAFNNCLVQGDMDKYVMTDCRAVTVIAGDIEGTGIVYTFAGSTTNFRAIGNDLSGHSAGAYTSGTPGGPYTFLDADVAKFGTSAGKNLQFDIYDTAPLTSGSFAGLLREGHKNTSTDAASAFDLNLAAGTKNIYFGLNQTNGYIEHTGETGWFQLKADGTNIAEYGSYSLRSGIDNSIALGGASNRWSTVYAGTGTINTSDERQKENIVPLDTKKAAEFLALLKPVSYKWRDFTREVEIVTHHKDSEDTVETKTLEFTHARTHWGMIAQQVEQAMTSCGMTGNDFAGLIHDTETDQYGLRYDQFIPALIAVVQDQQKRLDKLEGK